VEHGRGAVANPTGRYERRIAEAIDDGWGSLETPLPALVTRVEPDRARRLITRNASPDVPFEQSINPYQGCEHGCVYCFARPSHAYLGLSPGLDFETRLFYKPDAEQVLAAELDAPGYVCKPITLGANTDPYQPVERKLRVTRVVLEGLAARWHPVSIITKGTLIERDLDLLTSLAERNLVHVLISVTTLDDALKRVLEPRAASPRARLRLIERLTQAGIPVGVLVAPIIPALTDHEIEAIVSRCASAGAGSLGYVLLRLPHELGDLFTAWLEVHFPDRAARILARIREMRSGRLNDPRFGHRMRGEGPYAQLLDRRFRLACERAGLGESRLGPLETSHFSPRRARAAQLTLDL
jgi:DNA repair photolyase